MALADRFGSIVSKQRWRPFPPGGDPEDPLLTPEEVAETARWLKETTGSHRQLYILRRSTLKRTRT
jgi:hypothetical protein